MNPHQEQQQSHVIASYHASTGHVKRSIGQSSVAASAYRAGVELVDERTGEVHDYTRRGGVSSSEILLPGGLTCDRGALWNAAEAAERRKDGRPARHWTLAVPHELDDEQRRLVVRRFALALVERFGVAVDIAMHDPDRHGDQRNHHAHLMLTTRAVEGLDDQGRPILGAKVASELSGTRRRKLGLGSARDELVELRELWAQHANDALEAAGRVERIDHRSLAAQGIDRAPTVKMGWVASAMERRGERSERGDINRSIEAGNAERLRLSAELIDLRVGRAL